MDAEGLLALDALGGASQRSMVERLQQERAEPYRAEGGWRAR